MGKTLVIAEKPSVATDLSRALVNELGRFEKKGKGRETWFENDNAIITSAVGHLVELRMPTTRNKKGEERKLPWNLDVLPAIPDTFELDPIEKTASRLRLVLKLIVNACDAGREGELIFRYIMDIGRIKKPIQRLWMQSMTRDSIIEAWHQLRSDEDMQSLADAARCRSESDWLVGLNATRALTCFRSRHGGFNITSAGRVQTPTLAILAARESEIEAFNPETYFEVHGTFGVQAGDYDGRWFDEAWKKDPEHPHRRAERIWDHALADAIKARCDGKTGRIEEKKRPSSQIPPQLYDLTTLQREAPFSAKGTLQIAQALYEKHKMVTYPRTDSRYLPEDYTGTVRETMGQIANSSLPEARFAKAVLEGAENGPRLVKSKRIFDSKKVSDHFAIIPTGRVAKLSDTEAKLYEMIVRRFIAVFYPNAEFEQTTRITRIDHSDSGTSAPLVTSDRAAGPLVDSFRTEGRVLVKPGWLEVYGRKPGAANGKGELTAVSPGESADPRGIEIREEQTKPPARFTESTLLSAMEGAGKLLDDEALAAAMSERGLGTPATRAAIIETLITQKYIVRDGNGGRAPLHVTPNGMRLIELLSEMGVAGLTSPSLTGDWEYKLRQMEHGKLPRAAFMNEIENYTRDIVRRTSGHLERLKNKEFPDVDAPCPVCQATSLKQTDGTYECRELDCRFRANKYIAGRKLSEDEARELFSKGRIEAPLEGFRSRFNKPFEAGLKLDEKFKVQFLFEDEPDEKIELGDEHFIGNATRPDGKQIKVYQTEKAFHVPEIRTEKEPDGLRIGRKILQLEIPKEQAIKLIGEGKSDLLKGFISKRTKRPFSAHLTLDAESGKLGFEFQERKKNGNGKS
jgi:DNA topoisomerase-3